MERHSSGLWWVGFIGTVLILGAFAISSLVLTNVGIGVYKNVVSSNNENFELRTSLNYVATRVRQKDSDGRIDVIDKDGTKALKLSYMGSSGYEINVYIYHYNGYLREHMCLEGDPFELSYGFEMIEIEDFDMELDGSLLKLSASNHAGESESLMLTLRSETE